VYCTLAQRFMQRLSWGSFKDMTWEVDGGAQCCAHKAPAQELATKIG